MSKVFKKTVLPGALAVAGVAAVGAPTLIAHAEPAEDSPRKSCELTVLPGQDGVENDHWLNAVDGSGAFTVGGSYDKDGKKSPTIWDGEKPTLVDAPGDQDAALQAVNSKGQAVGNLDGGDSQSVFVYTDGKATELDGADGVHVAVTGINDAGTIVGSIARSKTDSSAVTWDANDPAAKPQPLETVEGGTSSSAFAIDASGNIAGSITGAQDPAPMYVWKGGTGKPEPLPFPADDGLQGRMTPIDYAEGWALGGANDGQGSKEYLYAPGQEPVEYQAVEIPRGITQDGWVVGAKNADWSGPGLASPEGEVTDLPLPDGFTVADSFGISADGAVVTATARDAERTKSVAVKWTCQ